MNLSNTLPAQINLSWGETGDALNCVYGFGPLFSSCSSSWAQDTLYKLTSAFNFYVNVVATDEAKSC